MKIFLALATVAAFAALGGPTSNAAPTSPSESASSSTDTNEDFDLWAVPNGKARVHRQRGETTVPTKAATSDLEEYCIRALNGHGQPRNAGGHRLSDCRRLFGVTAAEPGRAGRGGDGGGVPGAPGGRGGASGAAAAADDDDDPALVRYCVRVLEAHGDEIPSRDYDPVDCSRYFSSLDRGASGGGGKSNGSNGGSFSGGVGGRGGKSGAGEGGGSGGGGGVGATGGRGGKGGAGGAAD